MNNNTMIKKFNLDINKENTFNNYYVIELKEITKELKEGTKTVYNVIEEMNKVIDFKEYYNIIAGTTFFKSLGGKERITKSYTIAGYLPTRLISTSPDGATKIERIFTIKRNIIKNLEDKKKMDKIYNKYNNTVLTLEELEKLQELQEVTDVINCGNSGYKIGYTWCVVELQDGQEINVYVK